MTLVYVETSALVKRYFPESGTEIVDELFDQHRPDETFVTSLLSVLEVTAAAARLVNARLLRQPGRRQLLAALHQDLNALFHVIPVDSALFAEAMTVSTRHGLRALDAFHMATVLRLRDAAVEAGDSVIVVSSDREVLAAAGAEGMSMLDPNHPAAQRELRRLRVNGG